MPTISLKNNTYIWAVRIENIVDEAELSLTKSCPQPQAGSQSLNKAGERIYSRESLYISGANSAQLKQLSAGLSDAMPEPAGSEVRRTADLR